MSDQDNCLCSFFCFLDFREVLGGGNTRGRRRAGSCTKDHTGLNEEPQLPLGVTNNESAAASFFPTKHQLARKWVK